jgi:threonine/homoserine/homoserine lactone efflux protein
MLQTAHLWLFFVMVFGVILLPGLDMAYVMASSLVGGWRRGLVATAGVVAGGACHVVMAMLGVMTLLRVVPAAFNALLVAGAAYIAWIGWTLLRSRATFAEVSAVGAVSTVATFRRGLLTCMLNPKAYLFMLAVFPQFLKPEYGVLGTQAVVLWAIIAVTQVAIYGGMALAGDRLRRWLAVRPGADAWLARCVGSVLLAAAVLVAWQGWTR